MIISCNKIVDRRDHVQYLTVSKSYVGPQNAPLHNMLLLVAYCVPCIHNMLRWSILCTLHTQYATRGAYCVGSVHMLFQWSSEGTQNALLENMSRGMFAFLSNCPLDIHLSILRTLCLKPCPHHNCIIVVFNPHRRCLQIWLLSRHEINLWKP